MRLSGAALPWHTWQNPPATPRRTCSWDTVPIQYFVIIVFLSVADLKQPALGFSESAGCFFGFQAAGILFNHLAAQFVGGIKHHFYAGHGIGGERHIAALNIGFFFIDNMQIQAHFV